MPANNKNFNAQLQVLPPGGGINNVIYYLLEIFDKY